jgi:hypothetical protein
MKLPEEQRCRIFLWVSGLTPTAVVPNSYARFYKKVLYRNFRSFAVHFIYFFIKTYSSAVIDPTLDGKYITGAFLSSSLLYSTTNLTYLAGVAFRRAFGWNATSYTLSQVTVRFGHARNDTTRGHFLRSFNGTINIVYDGPFTYNAADCGGSYCPFDARITFSKPFLYRNYPGGLEIDIATSVASTNVSWEFAADVTGCTYAWAQDPTATLRFGIWLNRAAQLKVFATDTLPPAAATPVAAPATPETEFFLPKSNSATTLGTGDSFAMPFSSSFTAQDARTVTVRLVRPG